MWKDIGFLSQDLDNLKSEISNDIKFTFALSFIGESKPHQ